MKILDSSWDKDISFKVLTKFGQGAYGIAVFEKIGFIKTEKYIYETKDIQNIGVVNEETQKSKSFVGTALGAGLGTLALGAVGFIAGALAGGNKQNKKIKLGIKFKDKNWILAEYDTKSTADKLNLYSIQQIKIKNKEAPF